MILVERPPNFEQILKAFPNAGGDGVIFAFGDYIYNPSGKPIPEPLLRHESVHQSRQLKGTGAFGDFAHGPEAWWTAYINDAEFRYREELLAHVAEYKAQLHGIDRNQRAKLLTATAARLVAPLYNYQPPRSLTQAIYDLKWEINR